MRSLMEYTGKKAVLSYALGHAVVVLSGILVSYGVPREVFAFGASLALMLCWPLLRDLTPVCVCVVWKGYWPNRKG